MLCHVHPDLDILFVKLTAQIGDSILKTSSVHYGSGVKDFIQILSSFLIS